MRKSNRWSAIVAVALLMMGLGVVASNGHVARAVTTISQLGADIDGEAADDNSGYSIAMSSNGDRIAIGARQNDANGTNSGHVRIYTLTNGTWVKTGDDINGQTANEELGSSVAMSADGNRIAIGANGPSNSLEAGVVRIYTWSGTAWTQTGSDINGKTAVDKLGLSVAMSADGNRIAIGANGPGSISNAGAVRIYTLTNNTWTQTGDDINGEGAVDLSGYKVAMSSNGDRIAIGASLNDGNGVDSGHVRVYTWSGTAWTQTGDDINGESAVDLSGSSVAMSADGNRIAIGSPFNDGNGTSAGHVRIYTLTNNTWTQTGNDINGEAANDGSGYSIAMSEDGDRIAIGAPYNDDSFENAGHVRVYTLSGSPTAPTTSTAPETTPTTTTPTTPTNPPTTTTTTPTTTPTNPPTTTTTTPTTTNTTVPVIIAKTPSIKTGATSSLSALIKATKISVSKGSKVMASISNSLTPVCKTSGSKVTGVAPGKCIVKIKITPKKGKATTKSLTINIVGSPSVKRGTSITLINAAAAAGLTTGGGLSMKASVSTTSLKLCKASSTKITAVKIGLCSVTLTVTSSSGATATKQLVINVQ